MLRCWEFNAKNRPGFAELVSSLSMSLETMAGYMDVSVLGGTTDTIKDRESSELNDAHRVNEKYLPCEISPGCERNDAEVDIEVPATPAGTTTVVSTT